MKNHGAGFVYTSWWPEALPSEDEYKNAVDNLETVGWQADFISYCCADSVQKKISEYYENNELTQFFENVVKKKYTFKKWFFGHYHQNGSIDNKYICTFERIRKTL